MKRETRRNSFHFAEGKINNGVIEKCDATSGGSYAYNGNDSFVGYGERTW